MAIMTSDEYREYLKKQKKKKKNKEENIAPPITSGGVMTSEEYRKQLGLSTVAEQKEQKDKRTYFQKGAFSDGYQVGDIGKTALATVTDINENLTQGILGMGEKAIDAGAYVAGAVGGIFGADEFQNDMQQFVSKDLYNEEEISKSILNPLRGAPGVLLNAVDLYENRDKLKGMEKDEAMAYIYGLSKNADKYSVLGEKIDGYAQSAGQLVATYGLQSVGVPWWLTTGVTSFGGEVEQAFNEDASYLEAGISGGISAGLEVGLEKLSGGISFGGKTADEGLKQLITDGIKNKALKTLTKWGFDGAGEGLEEVLTEFGSEIGRQLTYEREDTLKELLTNEEAMDDYLEQVGTALFGKEARENYLEAGIGGFALGGGVNVSNAVNSIKTGRDYDTGFSDNEQSVVDQVSQQEIQRQEQESGKSLTTKEKNAIKKDIETMLKRGEIDTDTIEKTFGGESYTAYDNLRKESDEYKTLADTPLEKLSLNEQKRRDELDAKNTEKSYSDRLLEAQGKLSETVNKATENDMYLRESFAEKGRKGEVFKLSEEEKKSFTAEEMKIVNKAIESGDINNTRKAHDMVSFVAKLSAQTKTDFDFTNNKKLAEAGYIVEGKTIDGFKEGNKIAVNLQSKKALNTVVGHEITHVLEGTDLYTALQSTLKEYATTKGVYDSLFNKAKENYKNVYKGLTEAEYNAKIEQEVTADLVGDYIFSDMDFVRNLSTKNPNVFQKVFNEIKYMLKVATAGSDAEKQLLKAKKIFEDVYRDTKRNTSEEVRYALNSNFPQEVDAWYNDKEQFDKKGGFFRVGSTSDALKSIGVKEQEIIWDKSKIRDIMEDHPEMTIDVIKTVPNAIENPVIVMQSNTKFNSITIYGEVYANVNGEQQPVMVAMLLKPEGRKGRILDIQKISSAYVRAGETSEATTKKAQSLINNSEILYVDPNEKRTNDWLRALRLQLPAGLTKYGSIGKVTYYEDVVKKEKEDFGKGAMADAFKRANINTSDTDFSLSDTNQDIAPIKNGIYGKDVMLDRPIAHEPQGKGMETQDIAPVREEQSVEVNKMIDGNMYAPVTEEEANAMLDSDENMERMRSLQEADEPQDIESPAYDNEVQVNDPFDERDIKEVGKRNVNAYMYDNPEVKPFYQDEARIMLGELQNSVKGERFYNDQLYYDTNGEQGFSGTSRMTSDEIAELLDNYNYSYAEIEKGLKAIIEDHGAENIAVAKRIEFFINERLLNGYTDFQTGMEVPRNQEYVNMLEGIQVNESANFDALGKNEVPIAPQMVAKQTDIPIAPEIEVHASAPLPLPNTSEVKGVRMNAEQKTRTPRETAQGKLRSWTETSTESEVVNREILPEDLDQSKIYYEPISNKKTLDTANANLDRMGYDKALEVFNAKLENRTVSLSDIALGERLVQESLKRGDTKTTGELIQNIAILGTELGQKVQALSIIQRMTPEGQLKMLQKVVNRGKAKGDKVFDNVEITQEMIDKILAVYGKDGTYDQNKLNEAVEQVKQDIADQMSVSKMDKVNAWRYLAMLGNPKTHIRNIVSNITMQATTEIKDLVARTTETLAPIKNRTKTFKQATEVVKRFAEQSTAEAKAMLTSENSYSESADIKSKRDVFKTKILQKAYDFNNDLMTKEDWWFKKARYKKSLQEFLTANGIETQEDINNNPKLVEKGKKYATEQAQIATFQQTSWLANKINEIERKNVATQVGVGAILPFKKTPINIAKTGLAYSPLGFAKSLTYDLHQMKKGNIEASQVVDNLAKGVTGSALVYIGYMLAMSGLLNGGGEDDKEGKYDYQLGEQSYSLNFGGSTYSLNWLTPVAMPLFIGANAFEMLEEDKELSFDTTSEALAQTLDPLSEMSFLSSLDSVLTSYESGMGKFAGIGEAMLQNYATQFAPTLMSQVAQFTDDTKRSTTVAGDSDARIIEQTINKLKYKIPGLRQTLEPTIDIWGNEVKQTENVMARAFETFIAPYSRKDNIANEIDAEIKEVYSQTGDNGVIPTVPNKNVQFKGEKYKMSADEYTDYKKVYGQLANDTLEDLFKTSTYQNSDANDKAELVNRVYKYASDEAKKDYLAKEGVEYTNTTEDNVPVYKTDKIKGAIDNDMSLEEFDLYNRSAGKYYISKVIGGYDTYKAITSILGDIESDKDIYGKTVSNSRKIKVVSTLNNLDADYYTKILMYKAEYPSDDRYNAEIINYLNEREDISYQEMSDILTELGFTVTADGKIRW